MCSYPIFSPQTLGQLHVYGKFGVRKVRVNLEQNCQARVTFVCQ